MKSDFKLVHSSKKKEDGSTSVFVFFSFFFFFFFCKQFKKKKTAFILSISVSIEKSEGKNRYGSPFFYVCFYLKLL